MSSFKQKKIKCNRNQFIVDPSSHRRIVGFVKVRRDRRTRTLFAFLQSTAKQCFLLYNVLRRCRIYTVGSDKNACLYIFVFYLSLNRSLLHLCRFTMRRALAVGEQHIHILFSETRVSDLTDYIHYLKFSNSCPKTSYANLFAFKTLLFCLGLMHRFALENSFQKLRPLSGRESYSLLSVWTTS